ncbi:hypothetical protein ACI782_24700 [Geodermatophilus sp. SYSU D00703]
MGRSARPTRRPAVLRFVTSTIVVLAIVLLYLFVLTRGAIL